MKGKRRTTPPRDMPLPKARKDGLEVQYVADEVLIYDVERHRAHCINKTAATVWEKCDGKSTLGEVTRIVQDEIDPAMDEDVVVFVLDGLRRTHLLDKPFGPARKMGRLTRREFVKKLRKLGIAASVVLPLATSVVAPTPAFAQTCVGANGCGAAPNCTPCNPPGCGGLCCGSYCTFPFLARIFCGC